MVSGFSQLSSSLVFSFKPFPSQWWASHTTMSLPQRCHCACPPGSICSMFIELEMVPSNLLWQNSSQLGPRMVLSKLLTIPCMASCKLGDSTIGDGVKFDSSVVHIKEVGQKLSVPCHIFSFLKQVVFDLRKFCLSGHKKIQTGDKNVLKWGLLRWSRKCVQVTIDQKNIYWTEKHVTSCLTMFITNK